jgi:hypothetical protein
LNRRKQKQEDPTDGEAIPRISYHAIPIHKVKVFIRGIASPSVGIILVWFNEVLEKETGGKKMNR